MICEILFGLNPSALTERNREMYKLKSFYLLLLIAITLSSWPSLAAESQTVSGWHYYIPNDWQATLVSEDKVMHVSYLVPEPEDVEDLPLPRVLTAFRVREIEESAVTSLAKLIVEIMERKDATIVDIGDEELRRAKGTHYKYVEFDIVGQTGVETHLIAYLDGDDSKTAMIHIRGMKQLAEMNRKTLHRFFRDVTKAKAK